MIIFDYNMIMYVMIIGNTQKLLDNQHINLGDHVHYKKAYQVGLVEYVTD